MAEVYNGIDATMAACIERQPVFLVRPPLRRYPSRGIRVIIGREGEEPG